MFKRILVIEDDGDLRRLLTDWLTSEGYTIQTPESFTAAVAALQAGEYDLVLTDHHLEAWRDGGNGHHDEELYQHFRPGVPVLFMSGSDPEVLARHDLPGHRCARIAKPLDIDQLLRELHFLLTAAA